LYEIYFYRDRNGGCPALDYFLKQTQKTPSKEIEKAKSTLADYRERSTDNE
jgi:phage-related protein